jgi:hypothetical protein
MRDFSITNIIGFGIDKYYSQIKRTENEMLVMADKTKNEMLVAAQRIKDNLSTGFLT